VVKVIGICSTFQVIGLDHEPQNVLSLQDMYDNLRQNIEDVTRKQIPLELDGEFAVFSNTEQINHPSIIKVTIQ